MARSISTIKAQMVAEKNTQASLSGLTSTSQTAIWNLWIYIVAVAINLFEQVLDLFKIDIETQISKAAVGSDAWVQAKMFELQYSATIPQVMTLNNYAPVYNPIDTTLRIISRCSVKTAVNKTVNVKVATGNPPAALSAPQLTAAKGYLNNTGSSSINGKGIGFAGVQYNVTSLAPDLIYVGGQVKYDGQYSSNIQANVITAINDYLANIEFDGVFRIATMVDYLQTVPGFIDITLNDVALRADATPWPTLTYLITSNYQSLIEYPLTAGYAIGETTIGATFADTITFLAV